MLGQAAWWCTCSSGARRCCGMAGTYGHEAEHRDTSERIYELSWRRHVAAEVQAGRLLATGYSCRSQSKRFDGVALPHPAQALLRALHGPGPLQPERSPTAKDD